MTDALSDLIEAHEARQEAIDTGVLDGAYSDLDTEQGGDEE